MYKALLSNREKILEKIAAQNPDMMWEIKHMEKGLARVGKTVSDEDLALLIDKEDDIVAWVRGKGIKPRPYQIMILRSQAKTTTVRAGRRLGKSWCAAMMIAYELETNPNAKVIVVEPTHTSADILKDEIQKLNVNPSKAHWLYGNSQPIDHGFNPDLLILEEPDYLYDHSYDAALVLSSKKRVIFMTPTNKSKHGLWLEYKAEKAFHFPSYCSPWWNEGTENMFKKEYSLGIYKQEIEARW